MVKFQLKNGKNDPRENKDAIFSHLIHFYMAQNDLYGQVSLVR